MTNIANRQLTVLKLGTLAPCCACFVLLLLSTGCRETPTTVKGQVTLDGKRLEIGKGMRGSVVFQPTAASGVTLSGLIDANGQYELSAGGSLTVTPSVYWVTVSATELVPATNDRPPTGRLITPAKYARATDSGFRIAVVPGENEVDLPLVSEGEEPADAEANAPPEPGKAEPANVDSPETSASAPK